MARAFLRQAADLIDHPSPAGPWGETDEALLQGLGRLSMAIAGAFRAAEGSLEGLGAALGCPGARFLDVGTGTGWLAIATARAYPAATVVGLDVFEPALALARANVAASDVAARVELPGRGCGRSRRRRRVRRHLAAAAVPARSASCRGAVAACRAALKPGGWVLPGTFAGTR